MRLRAAPADGTLSAPAATQQHSTVRLCGSPPCSRCTYADRLGFDSESAWACGVCLGMPGQTPQRPADGVRPAHSRQRGRNRDEGRAWRARAPSVRRATPALRAAWRMLLPRPTSGRGESARASGRCRSAPRATAAAATPFCGAVDQGRARTRARMTVSTSVCSSLCRRPGVRRARTRCARAHARAKRMHKGARRLTGEQNVRRGLGGEQYGLGTNNSSVETRTNQELKAADQADCIDAPAPRKGFRPASAAAAPAVPVRRLRKQLVWPRPPPMPGFRAPRSFGKNRGSLRLLPSPRLAAGPL